MVGSVLRTPISAKYCWFGWWLGAWSTPSHHPTQLCDIYISGYEYTLISEWTRLFGLLRILDNLISGAVCYFCTTISVFCEIYTLRMRVVAHAAILWVWWFLCRRPELGWSICPHQIPIGLKSTSWAKYTSTNHRCIYTYYTMIAAKNNHHNFCVLLFLPGLTSSKHRRSYSVWKIHTLPFLSYEPIDYSKLALNVKAICPWLRTVSIELHCLNFGPVAIV